MIDTDILSIDTSDDKLEKLLSVDETAEILGISKATLYTWVCRKKIGVIKICSRALFDPRDIREYIDSHRVKPIRITNMNREFRRDL